MSNIAEKIKPLKKGAVVYPRAYHIDSENPDNSFIEGVTQGGQSIIAYLKVDDEHKASNASDGEGRTIPSIKDLSSKNPAAPRRCEASKDNGPDNPTKGVLLVEQIQKVTDSRAESHPGKFVCESKWISILQQSDYMPAKMTKGHIEISFHRGLDSDQKKQKAEYLSLKQKLDDPNEDKLTIKQKMQSIQRDMILSRKMFLALVDIKSDDMVSIPLYDESAANPRNRVSMLKNELEKMVVPLTEQGMYGGAILRLRNGLSVSPLYTASFAMQFDFVNKKVMPFEEVFNNFQRFEGKKLVETIMKVSPNMKLTLDIIPCQRINFGKKSNDPYKKDIMRLESSKTLKTYVDETAREHIGVIDLEPNDYMASFMASRTAIASEENCIISRAHSFTGPMVKSVLIAPDLRKYEFTS